MNFAEARFWGLLLVGLGLIALLSFTLRPVLRVRRDAFDKLALFGLGLFLLLCVSWVTAVIFLGVAVGSYVGLKWLLSYDEKGRWHGLCVLIPLQLLPLAYYKYANFAVNDLLRFDFPALRNLVVPVGISFYSFQKVAFVIDTLVFRQPLPRFLDYLNFAGFFPQIVAGPIERRSDLLPQMEQFRFRWSAENLDRGVSWIVVGLFFKLCLADNLSTFFNGTSTTNAYLIWLDNLLFGLRIYYDFAGYSLIALGLARCLGVKLTLNFCSPYCACSVIEFWRRWHVTLSRWFRDYLYIPLGGGRVRWWRLNIALVFVVSGVWHGAGWNFVFWGAMHGAALMVNRTVGLKLKLPAFPAWLLTMTAVFCAWLGFYETDAHRLALKLKTLLTPVGYNLAAFREASFLFTASGFVMMCFLMLAGLTLLFEWLSVAYRDEPYYFLCRPAVLVGLIILIVALAPGRSNGFIYFAF